MSKRKPKLTAAQIQRILATAKPTGAEYGEIPPEVLAALGQGRPTKVPLNVLQELSTRAAGGDINDDVLEALANGPRVGTPVGYGRQVAKTLASQAAAEEAPVAARAVSRALPVLGSAENPVMARAARIGTKAATTLGKTGLGALGVLGGPLGILGTVATAPFIISSWIDLIKELTGNDPESKRIELAKREKDEQLLSNAMLIKEDSKERRQKRSLDALQMLEGTMAQTNLQNILSSGMNVNPVENAQQSASSEAARSMAAGMASVGQAVGGGQNPFMSAGLM